MNRISNTVENHFAGGILRKRAIRREDLFRLVRSHDYFMQQDGERVLAGNHFLEAIMLTPDDPQRHKITPQPSNPDYCYYLGYLVKNGGKAVDLRDCADEIYAFDVQDYDRRQHERADYEKQRKKWDDESLAELAIIRSERDKQWLYSDERAAPWNVKWWLCEYRRVATQRERRLACDEQYKGLIRSKRSNLPHYFWDEVPMKGKGYSWKSRDTKARRQWEVKLPKHIDTVVLTVEVVGETDDE
jgi:hypothetical protein